MAKKKKSSFKGKVNRNVSKQKSNARSFGYLNLPEDMKMFKEQIDERVYLDIIPYIVSDEHHMDREEDYDIATPGEIWYKKPYKIHRNIGPNNEAVVCPTTFGKRCPICEYRQKLFKDGADKELTRALNTSLRNLYIVIPIGHKKYEEVPHIWDISQHNFQNLLNKELDEDEDYETFPGLEDGLTLKIRFDEASVATTKFAEATRIDFKERDEAYGEEILEDVPDLDTLLKVHSYKELETMLYEYDEVDDEDEDEKETRKYRDADDDEDESPKKSYRKKKDASPEDDDEDENPKPKRRKKKDKEEEEEEEEKPQRSKPTRSKSGKKSDDKCPHGHKFGIDTEDYDECDECDLWRACIKAKEKNEDA